MSDSSGMIGGGIGASAVIVGGILYKIYRAINHKKITISCCGRTLSASIDIDPLDEAEKGEKEKTTAEEETGAEAPKNYVISPKKSPKIHPKPPREPPQYPPPDDS